MSRILSYGAWTCLVLSKWAGEGAAGETVLPQGEARAALVSGHFPDRVHEFVWRNWNVVEPAKLAKILALPCRTSRRWPSRWDCLPTRQSQPR